jgi:heat shock protein HslJ
VYGKRGIATLIAFVLTVVLVACGGAAPVAETPDTEAVETPETGAVQPEAEEAPSGESVGLAGTRWTLTELNGAPLVEGTNITLNFGEGETEGPFEGFGGCNGYGGTYAASNDGALSTGEIMSTMMLCEAPEGVADQEQQFLLRLAEVVAYEVTDSQLALKNDAGETLLLFSRGEEEADMNPADLLGTAWQLRSLNGSDLVEGSTITLAFLDEGTVIGHAGCREYVFSYGADADGINFPTQSMLGEEDCLQDEALWRQEGQYTDSFTWARSYRLSEGQLELLTARGETLLFDALPEEANASLEGTAWRLTGFVEQQQTASTDMPAPDVMVTGTIPQTEITASFEGSEVNGSAGCNSYGGPYQQSGSELTFGPLSQTRMACEQGIGEQEQRYLTLLRGATTYRVVGNLLYVEAGDGQALVFAAPG